MKKQFLALIALGSLVNTQAGIYEFGGFVWEEKTLSQIDAIQAAGNAAVEAINQSGRVAVKTVSETGSQVLNQIRLEAAKFAAAIPQPVIKESIVEQIQRLGFKQYATKAFEQAKNLKVDLVPLAGCMIAGALVEPAVTAVYNGIYNTVWAERSTQEDQAALQRRMIADTNSKEILAQLEDISRKMVFAAGNTGPIATHLSTIKEILNNELRTVCVRANKITPQSAHEIIGVIEIQIQRVNDLNNKLEAISCATNPASFETKRQAEVAYVAEAQILAIQAMENTRAMIKLEEQQAITQAQLFPKANSSRLFPFSKFTKSYLRKITVGAMVYGGYVFVTTK